jgi:hypothetical protein
MKKFMLKWEEKKRITYVHIKYINEMKTHRRDWEMRREKFMLNYQQVCSSIQVTCKEYSTFSSLFLHMFYIQHYDLDISMKTVIHRN